MNELTPQQIERQDIVDTEIFTMLQYLAPENVELEWDIETIANIREIIYEKFEDLGIMTEMEFYPYMELADTCSCCNQSRHDGFACDTRRQP